MEKRGIAESITPHFLTPFVMRRLLMACVSVFPILFFVLFPIIASAQQSSKVIGDLDVVIGYLEFRVPPPPVLSNLEKIPDDEGLAGAQLAIKDNDTTGKFLKHHYSLVEDSADTQEEFLQKAKKLLARTRLLAIKAPRDQLVELAQISEAKDAILFNVSDKDDELRSGACVANLFHTIPSRAMLADAVAQFAVRKKWINWVMVYGDKSGDLALAQAFRNSAKKFHINLEAEKQWVFDADMRRNASADVPLFTQDFPDHDLVIIADEIGDFGRYVMYNTWLPRPVAGSEGIAASAWSASVEQYGAAQLQSRFSQAANRNMRPVDYASWAAIRAIGEAVTRTASAEAKTIRSYMLSDKFELAGFKGRKLTWRSWNGQLRQPIPLSHPRAVVTNAPLEGFLHQRNELDTLGLDKAESKCVAFGDAQ